MRRLECWWNGLDGSAARWLALFSDGRRWQVMERNGTGATETIEHDDEATARAVLADCLSCDRRGKRQLSPPAWRRIA